MSDFTGGFPKIDGLGMKKYGGAPFLQDLFAGTNGTHLESHTPNIGGAWTQINFGLSMLEADLNGSGKVVAQLQTLQATAGYINAAVPPTNDYKAYFTMTVGDLAHTDDCYVFIRAGANPNTSSYNFGFAVVAAKWQLRSGTTVLASSAVTLVQGNIRKIECRAVGTTISGWVDGVQVLSVTDAAVAGPGKVAIYLGGSSVTSGGFTGYGATDLYGIKI